MTKRFWPLVAAALIPAIAFAAANPSLFDSVVVNNALTVGGAVKFSTFTSGTAIFDASGNMSSLAPGASGNLLTSNGSIWTSASPPASGVLSLGAFGSSPNGNAGTIAGTVLTLQPADGSNPGGVSTGAQTFAGVKTFTNPIVGTQASSDNSTTAASTAFVQTALAQLNPAAAVVAASTANIPGTYTNAVGGVCIGDTFRVTSTSAFAPDGVTLTVGQRFLMKDQTSSFQDGVWTLTTAANIGVLGALLTRALDFDSSADINAGQIIPVAGGTVNAGSSWYQTGVVTTCSSDAQTWTQFQKASSAYASSTLTNTHLYVGNSSNVATDVAASGDLTLANTGAFTIANLAVTNAKIANSTIDLTAKVTGVLPYANGGTNAATSWTSGSVIFASSSTYAQDNTNLFWDNNKKYLGIDQTAPASRLHIKADADQQSGGIKLEATGNTNSWATWVSNGNLYRIYSYSLNASPFSIDSQEHFIMGAAPTGDTGTLGLRHPGSTIEPAGDTTLVIQQGTGQTGSAVEIYNTTPTLETKIDFAGALTLGAIGTTSGKAVFNGSTSGSVSLVSSANAGNFTFTLPPNAGSSGQVLKTDGTGITSWTASGGGGAATAVLTKTGNYTVLTGDFDTTGFRLLLEANCSSLCTITLPAASNTGYQITVKNIGTAEADVIRAGSDTIDGDTLLQLMPGGTPQEAHGLMANGGTRWDVLY